MREYIWVEEGSIKASGHKLCDPIPFPATKKPVRLWALLHFKSKAVIPPARLPLEHRKTALLEDVTRDWTIRFDHLIYRGQFAEGGVWLAVEYEGIK